ncbi:MAG: hypothetical protein OXC07_12650 [Kistimonas sp.]|nr:hypothetical protein [Kistimonas sp.]
MQTSSPSRAAQAAPLQPVVSASAPESSEKREIEINGRRWILDALASRIVDLCPVCTDTMGCRHVCGDERHCLCAPCFEDLAARSRILSCPLCRVAGVERSLLQVLDAGRERLLPCARMSCAECNDWTGMPTLIAEHAMRCGQREHSCPQAEHGCDWKGLLSDLALHEPHCAWLPKVCSHPGCPAALFSGTQKEHEARCGYRPVTMGALETTADVAQRLGEMNQFYRQSPDELKQLSHAQLRARVLQSAELVPQLYEAVAAAVSADMMEDCPWGCGFLGPRSLMEGHYPHCGKLPVDCNFCAVKIPREMLEIHTGICDERFVPCPHGCSERGVRFHDIESGLHERICSRAPSQCTQCRVAMPRGELEEHQRTCNERPRACGWCMKLHGASAFLHLPPICSRDLPSGPVSLGSSVLQLATQAVGAVYVRSQFSYETVYVYLPVAALRQELAERTQRNLTEGLSFMWRNRGDTKVAVKYVPDNNYFSVRIKTTLWFQGYVKCEAQLQTQTGTVLEQMGQEFCERLAPGRFMELRGLRDSGSETSEEGRITVINHIMNTQERGMFLRLGPLLDGR